MATSRDLFLAILALDSYNRGYNPGLPGLGDAMATQIGNATITSQSYTAQQQAISFYATAYTWNGETVISYRGTTFDDAPATFYGDSYRFRPSHCNRAQFAKSTTVRYGKVQ